MTAINYARQDIIQEDIDAVVEVLKSDMHFLQRLILDVPYYKGSKYCLISK